MEDFQPTPLGQITSLKHYKDFFRGNSKFVDCMHNRKKTFAELQREELINCPYFLQFVDMLM